MQRGDEIQGAGSRARDASYPIYILHQTVIIAIGFYVIRQPWTPWIKYAVVLAATLAICALLYQYCVRPFTLTRLAFGMKAGRRRPESVEASAAVV